MVFQSKGGENKDSAKHHKRKPEEDKNNSENQNQPGKKSSIPRLVQLLKVAH